MAIFATAASNSTSALSGDYGQAAQMIDMGCGPSFVQESVAVTGGVVGAPVVTVGIGIVTVMSILLLLL